MGVMKKTHSRTERKDKPAPVRLTERDDAVFHALFRFTILTTDQLHQLVGGGREGFKKRLRLLYDAGYIARPPIQREIYRFSEKRPTVHSLGRDGADYLRLEHGIKIPTTIDWERKAKDRKGFQGGRLMRHDLGANGAVIDLQEALTAIEGVEVLTAEEVVSQAPEWTQKAKFPYAIPTKFKWTDSQLHKRNVIPDGVLGYIDRRGQDPIRAMLFVEYDQKMNINRSSPDQSSIRQKIACYSAMFKNKTIKERFGFDHFRVLFITTGSPNHQRTMIDCCIKYRDEVERDVQPYIFFFSTSEGFEGSDNPLVGCWSDGDGKRKNITRLGS